MPINDINSIFSTKQAITAAAPSTNYMKTPPGSGFGNSNVLEFVVNEAFATAAGMTDLDIKWQGSADEFSTPVDLLESIEIPIADLKVGNTFYLEMPQSNIYPYVRVYYTPVGGDANAGSISGAIQQTASKRYSEAQKIRGGKMSLTL